MRYGEVSPSHREMFEPGSLIRSADTWLDMEHDISRVIAWEGAGLTFTETEDALRLRAELPRIPLADVALDGVRSGRLDGLSVEFRTLRQRMEHGLRVVELADMQGVGLVPHPSFEASRITEVRARDRTQISGAVALGKELACRCRKNCTHIRIEPDAFDAALKEAEAEARQIFAFITGAYESPVASLASRTLKIRKRGKSLEVEIDGLPNTQAARDFVETAPENFVTIRPYFPDSESDFRVEGTTAIFTRADLRALELAVIAGPTDGLEPVQITEQRRRVRAWL